VDVDLPEGLPAVSLSGLVPAPDAGTRLVPPLVTTARTLAETVRSVPCILAEDPPPDPLGVLVADRSGEPMTTIDASEVAESVSERGCGTVVWAGGPDVGAGVAAALGDTDVELIGGDRLLDHDFLAEAGAWAEGARAFCPCADVSTSTAFAVRRFIQDYQSEFGSAPAAYAVEGWDAGHVIGRAMRQGGPTRQGLGAWIRGVAAHRGLSGMYGFGTDGELLDPGDAVRVYRVVGGRWLSAPA
jgi:branched-chain amino acid transport system substrate-binding protein